MKTKIMMKRRFELFAVLLLAGFVVFLAKKVLTGDQTDSLSPAAERVGLAAQPDNARRPDISPDAAETRKRSAAGPAGIPASRTTMAAAPPVSRRYSADALMLRIRSLDRLEACFLSQDCRFDQSTPMAYHTHVSALIVRELRTILNLELAAGNIGEADRSGRRLSAAAETVARRFVRFPDDDVKAASLYVLAGTPPSSENLDAILAGLRESVSAPLYEVGLEVLSAYANVDGRERLDEFIIESIRRGGHFVSHEVARRSLAFINSENAAALHALAQELPQRSAARHALEFNLQEFARMQRGG